MRLVVVPTDAEALSIEQAGGRAEPLRRFVERLAGGLALRDVWASDLDCRVALAASVAEGRIEGASAPEVGDLHAALGEIRLAPAALAPLVAIARGGRPDRGAKRRGASLFDEPSSLSRRAALLVGALAALDARLERHGLTDPRLVHSRVAAALHEAEPSAVAALVGAAAVEIRGALDLPAAAFAWITSLDAALRAAEPGGGVVVSLPQADAPVDVDREKTPFEIVADRYERGLEDALTFTALAPVLGDGRFAGPLPKAALERVSVVRATDGDREHVAIADAVCDALAAGARPDRVIVAFPAGATELERACVRELVGRGVAVACPDRDLEDAGVVALLRRALGYAFAFDRRGFADVLESSYVSARALTGAEGSDASRAVRALAEAVGARRLPAGGAAEACAAVAARIEGDPAGDAVAARAARRLAAAYADVARATSRRALLSGVARLVATLGLAERAATGGYSFFASDEAPAGVTRAEIDALARDARAWDALVDHVEAYAASSERVGAASEAAAPSEVVAEVFDTLGAIGVRSGARAFAVRTARLRALGAEPTDLLVIAGATDAAFRAAASSLLSEALVSEVATRAREPALAPSSFAAAQRALALLVAATGAERTVFVYSAREDGAVTAPAPVVAWLERSGVAARPARDVEPGAARGDEGAVRARAALEAAREAYFLDPRRRPSGPVGLLAADAAARRVLTDATGGGARPLSVSGLERFATCPFAGFAAEVLRARDEALVGDRVDAREEGTLSHDALRAAFEASRSLLERSPPDEAAVVAAGLAAAEAALGPPTSPVERLEHERILDGVEVHLVLAARDDTWVFSVAERGFGGSDDPWPPIRLQLGDESLALRGRIDRVDVGRVRSAARAVDYKRSRSQATSAFKKIGETVFQVPLYARHAARQIGAKGAEGAYLPTTRRNLQGLPGPTAKSQAAWAELVDAPPGELAPIESRALGLAVAIRDGRLLPEPFDEASCRTCPVSGGCRRPRFTMKPDEEGEGA
ncbi:MAG: PD-(D/E)XK nuclease family protein [Myxococcales bacterium]|nr:PD-(D/E)XK nuclease family protein [Myxococcales bacterium]